MSISSPVVIAWSLSQVSPSVFRQGIDLGFVLPPGTAIGHWVPRRLTVCWSKTIRTSGWSSARCTCLHFKRPCSWFLHALAITYNLHILSLPLSIQQVLRYRHTEHGEDTFECIGPLNPAAAWRWRVASWSVWVVFHTNFLILQHTKMCLGESWFIF